MLWGKIKLGRRTGNGRLGLQVDKVEKRAEEWLRVDRTGPGLFILSLLGSRLFCCVTSNVWVCAIFISHCEYCDRRLGSSSRTINEGLGLVYPRSGRMGTAALGTPLRRRGLTHKQRAWPAPGTQRWSCSPAGRQCLGAETQGVGRSGNGGSL